MPKESFNDGKILCSWFLQILALSSFDEIYNFSRMYFVEKFKIFGTYNNIHHPCHKEMDSFHQIMTIVYGQIYIIECMTIILCYCLKSQEFASICS